MFFYSNLAYVFERPNKTLNRFGLFVRDIRKDITYRNFGLLVLPPPVGISGFSYKKESKKFFELENTLLLFRFIFNFSLRMGKPYRVKTVYTISFLHPTSFLFYSVLFFGSSSFLQSPISFFFLNIMFNETAPY